MYWRVWNGRAVKSTQARNYQRSVGMLHRKAPCTGEVLVEVRMYRARRSGDLDNCLKVVIDALKGIAYVDDAQIVGIHAERFEDPANPRIEVRVTDTGAVSTPPKTNPRTRLSPNVQLAPSIHPPELIRRQTRK